nr:hypothetical protein [Lachnospiraceae bacterium]
MATREDVNASDYSGTEPVKLDEDIQIDSEFEEQNERYLQKQMEMKECLSRYIEKKISEYDNDIQGIAREACKKYSAAFKMNVEFIK